MDGVVGRCARISEEGEYVVLRAFSPLQETLVGGGFGVTWLVAWALADKTRRVESYIVRIRVLWSLSHCGVNTAT
jgi:hypothetical protein